MNPDILSTFLPVYTRLELLAKAATPKAIMVKFELELIVCEYYS